MNSYSVINYKLRPQKQIERGLIAQLLNDFSRTIGNPINYIGMGSLVFADFIYFNKNCQLQKMISIEKMTDKEGNFDGKKEKRFLNNKPFSTIELISKTVSEAIDEIPLDENAFIWLDYDGQIETTPKMTYVLLPSLLMTLLLMISLVLFTVFGVISPVSSILFSREVMCTLSSSCRFSGSINSSPL